MASENESLDPFRRTLSVLADRTFSASKSQSKYWNKTLIVITTTRRPDYTFSLLKLISSAPCKKLILVSDDLDEISYKQTCSLDINTQVISIARLQGELQDRLGESKSSTRLRYFLNSARAAKDTIWDLPQKRNTALLKAATDGCLKLILLDDDVLYVTPDLLNEALIASASHGSAVMGILIKTFPDISVFDHIQLSLYGGHHQFISGNCLLVDLKMVSGFFPPIYNEDWLFIFAHERSRVACAINRFIGHRRHKPFNPDVAAWQEFGETIAEGTFNAWAESSIGQLYTLKFWETSLRRRREDHKRLFRTLSLLTKTTPEAEQMLVCLQASENESFRLEAANLVDYVSEYRDLCAEFTALNREVREKFADSQ